MLLIYGSTYSDVKRQNNTKLQTFHSTKVYFIPQLLIWLDQIQIPNVISHFITNCSSNDIKLFIPILPNQFTSIVCYFLFVCLVVFKPLTTIFQLYRGGLIYCWRKPDDPAKIVTCHKLLTHFIT